MPDDDYEPDHWQEYKDDLAMGRINEDGSQREPDEPDFAAIEYAEQLRRRARRCRMRLPAAADRARADPAELCAGWLAVAGYHHLTVRFAIITGHLPDTVLVAGDGWPVLFPSLAAMLAAQEGLIDA
jgi:hypothetical protein